MEFFARVNKSILNIQPVPHFFSNKLGNLKPYLSASAFWHPRIPYLYATDGNGFRSNSSTSIETPDKLILCLGDSYTFGVSVPDTATFPAALEKQLNAKSESPAPSYRIINSGTPDTGIEDIYLYYIDKARNIKPNLVILQFDIHNIRLLSKPYRYKFTRQDYTYNIFKDFSLARDISRLFIKQLEQFPAYSLLSKELFGDQTQPDDSRNMDIATQFLEKREYTISRTVDDLLSEDKRILDEQNLETLWPLWNRYLDVLLKLKQSVESDGIDFLLVIIPHHEQMNSFDNAPSAALIPFCIQNNIKYLDLTDKFRSLTRDNGVELFCKPFDYHCNVLGNSIIAEGISKRIDSIGEAPRKTAAFTRNMPSYNHAVPDKVMVTFDEAGYPHLSSTDFMEIVHFKRDNIIIRKEGDGSIQYVTCDLKNAPTASATLELRIKKPVDQVGAVFFPHLQDGDNRSNAFSASLSANNEETSFSTANSNAPERWKDLENMYHVTLKPASAQINTITVKLGFVRDGGFIFENKGDQSFRRFELLLYPPDKG
ncbi:SGNH/GDSL hydrolase family protein [Fundidesulfovibrio putealis]|uniref:SGNH/GDSL hydrolase family protein n=1 Tax=Fundidesulfovibrio putealis TaxID=270496 RepID=UPI0012ECA2B8|nr:SGNH/GDSL hydrolase family protein [Fundidesulfovibrio putealis]